MLRYIDTHSHPHFPQYDADRDLVFARMREAGVGTIAVGTSFLDSRKAVQLAMEHPDLVLGAVIGVHPNDSKESFEPEHFAGLLKMREMPGNKIVVGVGECGIDYFRSDMGSDGARQKENFEKQIAFAVEHDLPLMLHVRPHKGSTDAHDDAIDMIATAQARHGSRVRGTAHFFTGPIEVAKRYWSMGFTTAFPGVITFAPDTHEIVRSAPLNMILSETDAPYAAPIPHRGKRNEPAFVVHTVEAIADIRGEDREMVRSALLENAKRIFGLKLQG